MENICVFMFLHITIITDKLLAPDISLMTIYY